MAQLKNTETRYYTQLSGSGWFLSAHVSTGIVSVPILRKGML